jgi:5S rRNA maturation endonuclease (ribonuclease M5)
MPEDRLFKKNKVCVLSSVFCGLLIMNDFERAERLKKVFESLYEINKRIPIIVEGKRDISALRKIGLVGDIIALHGGKGLYEFCDNIAEKFHKIILLMDWDEKGESLHKAISGHLKGMWEEFSPFRDIIKILCQKDIKDIEGIPVLLEKLAGEEVKVGEEKEGFLGDI